MITRRLKHLVFRLIRATGAFEIVSRSRWRSERLLILCYHGVSLDDEHLWRPSLYLSPERFEERMKALEDAGCHALPFEEAVVKLREGKLPQRSVAITFDDGTFDFYARALPIMRQAGYPVTLYLTTQYVQTAQPIFNLVLPYMLWKTARRRVNLKGITGEDEELGLDTRKLYVAANERIRLHMERNGVNSDELFQSARRLAEELELDFEELLRKRIVQSMTAEEVADAANQGVDVQLHTHRHRVPVDAGLFQREIVQNRAVIEQITGREARHFCYPSGEHHKEFLPWLTGNGVVTATTCIPGLAEAGTEPLLLPRLIDVDNRPLVDFQAWLSGVASWFRRER